MTFCERCDGYGWAPTDDEQGIRRVQRCECWLTQHPSHVVGVPVFFASARLADFQSRPGVEIALAAAQRWLKGTHDLFLSGTVGSGKTRLACSLANESAQLGTSAAFFDVTALVDQARRADVKDHETDDPLPLCRERDVLVLDDIAALEKASDFTLRTLLSIYNARLGQKRRTIWTSNQTLDKLGEIFNDDRLPSRIAGAAEVVWVSASDFRVQGARSWAS